MKLYLLLPHDSSGWDVYCGAVIRASSEHSARKRASAELMGDNTYNRMWMDSTRCSCTVLSQKGKAGVVITDFKAG